MVENRNFEKDKFPKTRILHQTNKNILPTHYYGSKRNWNDESRNNRLKKIIEGKKLATVLTLSSDELKP